MLKRLRDERGMGMVELIAAVSVITIAILALMASYDQAFFSLHAAARKTAAASLAESQLELFSAAYTTNTVTTTTVGGTTVATTTVAGTATTLTTSITNYTAVGLNSTLLTTAKASDAYYSTDEAALSPTGADVSNSTCTSTLAQCMPVQTSVLGSDGKHYRVETFVRDVSQTLTCQGATTTCGTTTERDVTVIVRDPNVANTPIVYTVTAAFDQGPRS